MIICGIDASINGSSCTKFMLDQNDKIIKSEFLAFTTVKKDAKLHKNGIIFHYKKIQFKNALDKYIWMEEKIIKFCENVDLIAIENYAFSGNNLAMIGEFTGGIKRKLYDNNIPFTLFPIGTIKKYFTGKGNSKKDAMIASYIKRKDIYKIEFSDEILAKTKSFINDVVDSYAIASLLYNNFLENDNLLEDFIYNSKGI